MKVLSVKKENLLTVFYLIIISAGIVAKFRNEAVETFSMPVSKKVIVIDAGHGGWDPGKVGTDGVLEKDINLQIAKKLQSYLEQGGSIVIVTRIDDSALGESKREDMNSRKELANESDADILVSVHQNSFPSTSAKGAQVFYYGDSEKSKFLAECIQKEMTSFLDSENNRAAKANSDYYILRKTSVPAVIVECGFLSNDTERKKLLDETYQEKIAWSIYMGLINYFDNKEFS